MNILKVTDPAFQKYGRIVDNVDFTGLVEALKHTPCPENVVYEPSVEALEALPVMEELSRVAYGEMPIQIGYCNGHNTAERPGIPQGFRDQRGWHGRGADAWASDGCGDGSYL